MTTCCRDYCDRCGDTDFLDEDRLCTICAINDEVEAEIRNDEVMLDSGVDE